MSVIVYTGLFITQQDTTPILFSGFSPFCRNLVLCVRKKKKKWFMPSRGNFLETSSQAFLKPIPLQMA